VISERAMVSTSPKNSSGEHNTKKKERKRIFEQFAFDE
jgi:hypothetical protein